MEGAIRDNRDHIKKLKADIEADEKKLAKLKKDYKKDVVKEEMRGEDKDLEEMRGGSTYEEDDIQAEAEEVDVEDDVDVDVDVEDDIDIDDVSDKSEIEVDSELSGESSDVSAILGLLTKAQEKAGDMGDEKLLDQIGNTITYYTRAHVVAEMEDGDDDPSEEKEGARRGKRSLKQTPEMKEELNEEFARFQKLAGLIK
tara:strand:- start:44 stop:640 length:597 start_codon:yes stop_codon:yes gene_type:complete